MPHQPDASSLLAILRATRAACLISHPRGDGWLASPGLGMLLGLEYDWDNWTEERLMSLVHREDASAFATLLTRARRGEAIPPEQVRLREPRNGWVRFEIEVTASDHGLILVLDDITEKVQLESAFLDAQTRLNGLYDGAPVSIILWSREGRITGWNSKAEETLGYTRDAMIGQKLVPTLIDPAFYDAFAKNVSGSIGDNRGCDLVCDTLTSTGERLKVRWRTVPMRNRKGALIGLLSLAQDITTELAAAELLQKRSEDAEQMSRTKSEFIAIVSHELRTPLNGILGTSQLLESFELEEETRPLVETITRSGNKLLGIITAMVDYARADMDSEARLHAFSLFEALAVNVQRFEYLAQKKGLSFRLDIDPDIPDDLTGDEEALTTALRALCDNAIKFTSSGTVAVATRLVAQQGDRVRMQLSVSDTGIGMEADYLPHLYTPFRQAEGAIERQHEGIGLGLAITRKLVDRAGGQIEVTSTPGQGSCFTLSFDFRSP